MATSTGFDKTTPLGTNAVSQGDDEIRSFKSYMQAWWEDEHYGTDGSSSSAGVHKIGSARVYQQSAAPTFEDAGRLWHDTDDDSLWVSISGSWTQVSSNVQTDSINTWTARQDFEPSTATAMGFGVAGDTKFRFQITRTGAMYWGDGSSIPDIDLTRAAADLLKTNDGFWADSGISASVLTVGADLVLKRSGTSTLQIDKGLIDFNSRVSMNGQVGIWLKDRRGAGVVGTPSEDSVGVLYVSNNGANYLLQLRWGDGTTDTIATGPAV